MYDYLIQYLFTHKILNVAYYVPGPTEINQSLNLKSSQLSRREIQINNLYDNVKSFMI